jgi:hypothetical protein
MSDTDYDTTSAEDDMTSAFSSCLPTPRSSFGSMESEAKPSYHAQPSQSQSLIKPEPLFLPTPIHRKPPFLVGRFSSEPHKDVVQEVKAWVDQCTEPGRIQVCVFV